MVATVGITAGMIKLTQHDEPLWLLHTILILLGVS